jgi:TonB family protein
MHAPIDIRRSDKAEIFVRQSNRKSTCWLMETFFLLPARRNLIQLLCLLVVGIALPLVGITPNSGAQKSDKPANARKVLAQIQPEYPPDLRRAAIGGVVRLDIIVDARGTVGFVQIAGGNPILAEAAVRAVKQWKYVPASASTNIRVNLTFDPARSGR